MDYKGRTLVVSEGDNRMIFQEMMIMIKSISELTRVKNSQAL